MDVFDLRRKLIADYESYVGSFIQLRDARIAGYVGKRLAEGLFWPSPLLQLNPSFEPGEAIGDLIRAGVLHPETDRIFRRKKNQEDRGLEPLALHRHQTDAIRAAASGDNYVLTTGTGSGKSLAYIVPIVNSVLQEGSGRGIKAIVVYPMNALANSQIGELDKFLQFGYPQGRPPVTYARYTGQESAEERKRIIAEPPDILLTNYVMLELILTRPFERQLVERARGLRFLVLDELHTYRGRQGADVAMLVRRLREELGVERLQCVGTSATMAGPGTFAEQAKKVAEVASLLFGSDVSPQRVIGETLRRITPVLDLADPATKQALASAVANRLLPAPTRYADFVKLPLASWVESTFGLEAEPGTGRLRRRAPRTIEGASGAAAELASLTGEPQDACADALRLLLRAATLCEPDPQTHFPPFPFRLHQFISRGGAVYASLELPHDRHVTVHRQKLTPEGNRRLFPLVFCRECGQEYYSVRYTEQAGSPRQFIPREPFERVHGDDEKAGYLAVNVDDLWPDDDQEQRSRLPEDWLDGEGMVASANRRVVPRRLVVDDSGTECAVGNNVIFLPAPFRFCPRCGVAYASRPANDFAKLASLASEGRSTATTILCLSALRQLKGAATLAEQAKKLLSFTDNRQDASLQAGHFNDFVEVGLLRSAVYRAVLAAGPNGLPHDQLAQRAFEALGLNLGLYAANPGVMFQQKLETERAFRDVIGYRVYRDLQRGWRVTAPNLEQCGLLEIDYESLGDLCAYQPAWAACHPALAGATPATRAEIGRTLLDFMRRSLAINVDYLKPLWQDSLRQRSNQYLVAPWGIDENEKLEYAPVAMPRSRAGAGQATDIYISARGGFGQFLRRKNTLPHLRQPLSVADAQLVIGQLLEALRTAGLVELAVAAGGQASGQAYQVCASAMKWKAGDGKNPFHDRIRVPRQPDGGARVNSFFVDFYQTQAQALAGFEAHEHTAQVPAQARQEREERFRSGALPLLYCSPTMELGVDISELNVVNMRNVPPTPANYAQRSGRAGRSGQPALVFTYCTTGSSHDQYFFNRPEQMVAGAVAPPRLDLGNEDLIRAHVHAMWLTASHASLGSSLKEVLDLGGTDPSLDVVPSLAADLRRPQPKQVAEGQAERILASLQSSALAHCRWFSKTWLKDTLDDVESSFEKACSRWRSLYLSARRQSERQNQVILNAAASAEDRRTAEKLRREAESELALLTGDGDTFSDFYSYRYFASEGFLPGYNFPRLPLSAFIPARGRRSRDEFLQRPRFLAISEFGPRAIIYHEGSRYVIHKVMLPASDNGVATSSIKVCERCGYLHEVDPQSPVDLCERCGALLPAPLDSMLRLAQVATRRRDKISSDEEERQRQGYEITSAVRFAERDGRTDCRQAEVSDAAGPLAILTYGQAATIWRINKGWKHRANPAQIGYLLDCDRGFWAKRREDDDDIEEALSRNVKTVVPYVEDHRNALTLEPADGTPPWQFESLMAALKVGMQARYQLEDNELAAEILPSTGEPRLILFYESAEGGAGALRRLVEEPAELAEVSKEALSICHYDPTTGNDLRRGPHSPEDCNQACYDCLMNYTNQPHHDVLSRAAIKDLLLRVAAATTAPMASCMCGGLSWKGLENLCQSDLERAWLGFVRAGGFAPPTDAQHRIEAARTVADFWYAREQAAIYIDGPHHDFADRAARDAEQERALDELGVRVIRFGRDDDWAAIIRAHADVFGTGAAASAAGESR